MASPLVGIGAVNALLFAANTECRRLLQDHPGQQLPLYKIAIAGSGAGKLSLAKELLDQVRYITLDPSIALNS
jgi:hypothetical protein